VRPLAAATRSARVAGSAADTLQRSTHCQTDHNSSHICATVHGQSNASWRSATELDRRAVLAVFDSCAGCAHSRVQSLTVAVCESRDGGLLDDSCGVNHNS
jgi:NAD-dependent dihydropyrimidine dehydrogenase PreA subunit